MPLQEQRFAATMEDPLSIGSRTLFGETYYPMSTQAGLELRNQPGYPEWVTNGADDQSLGFGVSGLRFRAQRLGSKV